MKQVHKTKRYKRHFICFKCRKNFKQPNEKDLAEKDGELSLLLNAFYFSKPKKKISKDIVAYLNNKYFRQTINCPECRTEMVEVSMSFETPAKKYIKKWEILESHYRAEGFIHNSLPNKMKDYIRLLENSHKWHIQMLQNAENHKAYGESSAEAKTRLQENIAALENELKKLC
ncbi:hypothetical protein [uncultured Kordia sp.]|uniref:hypothetical protein n=1 Tax=uncultured Kordia sp. TaxID=507699 RepID=UPI00261D9BD9|nr:hypothetical protein [uncultured Kordia sp.]